jgi:hypothetical protein
VGRRKGGGRWEIEIDLFFSGEPRGFGKKLIKETRRRIFLIFKINTYVRGSRVRAVVDANRVGSQSTSGSYVSG